MASTKPANPLSSSAYRSCGRGFAAVDPERQREVEAFPRLVTKEPVSASKPRRAPNAWFIPGQGPSEEGGSCRHSR